MVGGNAVAEWVGRIDEDAVRNTRDVDILIRRPDFPAVRACLEAVGFIYHEVLDVDTFIDGPQGKPSGGIRLLYAGEKVRQDDDYNLPEIEESERAVEFQVVNLEALLLMKLTSYRLKDRVHILDMIGVGLIDATQPARFPALGSVSGIADNCSMTGTADGSRFQRRWELARLLLLARVSVFLFFFLRGAVDPFAKP